MKLISIFKLPRKKKDIYYADFSINGQKKRKSLKISTKDETVKKCNEYLKKWELKKEKLRFENNLFSTNIEDGFNEFFNYRKRYVQPSTLKHDTGILTQLKNHLINNNISVVKDINNKVLIEFLKKYEDKSLKTFDNIAGLISVLIDFFKEKIISRIILYLKLRKEKE